MPEPVPSAVRQAPGQGQDHLSRIRTTALTQAPVELYSKVQSKKRKEKEKSHFYHAELLTIPSNAYGQHSYLSVHTHTKPTRNAATQ